MNLSPKTESLTDSRLSRLVPWLCLLAAVCWSILLRVPLIQNAPAHLDSDLAVDGLTLQEAVGGHWRWHYPGTPQIGTAAVLLSWAQARVWGATPITLVSGGVVAYVLLISAVFALAWRVYGRPVALGSLVPLTFCSTGVLWLSAQITGGHLLVVAWSAAVWLLFHETLEFGGWPRLIALGVWCGLGLAVDFMCVMTLAAMVASALIWLILARAAGRIRTSPGGPRDGDRRWVLSLAQGLVVALAFLVGSAPWAIGKWVDPYEAYSGQFSWSGDARLVNEHARILMRECLPRLIAGHRLPGLETDPDPLLLGTGAPNQGNTRSREVIRFWAGPQTVLALGLFAAAYTALAVVFVRGPGTGQRALAAGLLATAVGVAAAFLINRNIFNSDNQRYLVMLLPAWSIGFGLLLRHALRLSVTERWTALACVVAFAALFTCDAAAWYRRFGWVDERFRPVRQRIDDPALRWLASHPEIRWIHGGYWDVYRLSFLTGGKVKGVPHPIFPNRFPEWSAGLPGGRPETLLARRSSEGQYFLHSALREGGMILGREGGLTFVSWPHPQPQQQPAPDSPSQ